MKLIAVISLTFSFTTAHITFEKKLNPVHGLFVQPSEDGVTGDLYVAATEDDGATSQWLTGLPINFLSTSASTQAQAASMPVTFTSSLTSSSSPNEETVTTQKKTVITSPPVKYTYAVPGAEGTPGHPYPYGLYAPNAQSSEEDSQCRPEGLTATSPALPAYPYPYYYPHMLTALSAAMHAVKEDSENSPKVSRSPHGWPAAYAYPYQYIMVDPTAWSHKSSATTGKQTTAKESE